MNRFATRRAEIIGSFPRPPLPCTISSKVHRKDLARPMDPAPPGGRHHEQGGRQSAPVVSSHRKTYMKMFGVPRSLSTYSKAPRPIRRQAPRWKFADILPAAPIIALASAMLCIICLACGPLSSRVVYDPKPSAERIQPGQTTLEAEVDELARPLIKSKEATCLEIGVLFADGSTRSYGYGRVSDSGLAELPDGKTIFQVGSVSKLFTASALEFLVQNGKINYTDTVRDILPRNVKLSADIGKITVYQLATHTSGLPREPVTFKQFRFFVNYEFTGENLYGYMDKAWLLNYLRTCRIKNKSHKFIYSNLGYGLLAYLIEVKTGEPFQDLVTQDIFSPLHMKDTVFSLSPEQDRRQAMGHVGDQPYFMRRNTPIKAWDMGEIMNPSGGIYSTAADLLIYAKHTLAMENSPLNPILFRTTEPKVHQQDGETSALGWTISEVGDDHARITYKHGMTSGYSTYIGMDMARNYAVVVLCNSFNWNDKIGHNLLLYLSRTSSPLGDH
ncbi:MAG: serine hydrolase [Holophaga sp.]|nr:serine hydrolase [Holophaga sp.]